MKIVIAPDSFKGSLSSTDAAAAIEVGVRRVLPRARCTKIPMADGGEGTVQALLDALGGKFVTKKVTGPLGEPVRARYALLADGETAVIEMAAASGLQLLDAKSRNPLHTTSFGTGELILAAIQKGAKKIIIGLGGSATVDAGMGLAQALGVQFFDKNSRLIRQYGNGRLLAKVSGLDVSDLHPAVRKTHITIASDVTNPLFGEQGAAYVYGPQKGATPTMVKTLDSNLYSFSEVVKRKLRRNVNNIKCAGAAGGLAYGLVVFAKARVKRGADLIAHMTNLKKQIALADLVITGEGRIDFQTAFGKTPIGVAKIAKKCGVPVVAIAGSLADDSHQVFKYAINGLESTITEVTTLDDIIGKPEFYLQNAAERVMRLLMIGKRIADKRNTEKTGVIKLTHKL